MKKLAFIGGGGRLGLPLALHSATKDYDVICADKNEAVLAMIREKKSPYPNEPGLQTLLGMVDISLTSNNVLAAQQADIIFVIVPTPSINAGLLVDGRYDLANVYAACWDISQAIKDSPRYRLVVIVSTVNPGDMEEIKYHLQTPNGLTAGEDFGLVYSPEFIRQGSILRDFMNATQVLIGQHDARAGSLAASYYESVCQPHTPIKRLSLIDAEIAKVGVNAAVTLKLGMVNQIAWLCHFTPGADATKVLWAMGADKRIGQYFMRPGTWPGGPCLPRDCKALEMAITLANGALSKRLMTAASEYHDDQCIDLCNLVWALTGNGKDATLIMGLSYKPEVAITDESQGIALAEKLALWEHLGVTVYDPYVHDDRSGSMIEELISDMRLLVLMTPHKVFRRLEEIDLSGKIVLDMWGFLVKERLNCERYIEFGKGEQNG